MLKLKGYDFAIALHLSSKISRMFNTAQTALKIRDFIDSKVGSFPMMKMIELGNTLFNEGKGVEDVITSINNLRPKLRLSFIP